MKKLLLIGIDTRSMLNSALKLNFDIYSTSYFSTSDTPHIKNQKIILKESDGESCGVFEDEFDSKTLIDLSKDYIDEVDYIIPISGVSPTDFKNTDQKKILGTVDVKDIENKFKFYTKIKDEFQTPKTFRVTDIHEAIEINKNYQHDNFILKPLQGNGGYNVNLLNPDIELENNKFIMQEYISGVNISSSILSSNSIQKLVCNSRLLTINDFENNNKFIYAGNILPLTTESIMNNVKDIEKINNELKNTSEKLAKKFKLLGSSGVDYILNENGIYVIEINPRLQGTFECVERTFNINMLDAHIKACHGEVIDIPKAQKYSYKKIIYSHSRVKYQNIELDNIYDLPHLGSITEKDEPLLTIIDDDVDFEKLFKKVELSHEIVNNSTISYPTDE